MNKLVNDARLVAEILYPYINRLEDLNVKVLTLFLYHINVNTLYEKYELSMYQLLDICLPFMKLNSEEQSSYKRIRGLSLGDPEKVLPKYIEDARKIISEKKY